MHEGKLSRADADQYLVEAHELTDDPSHLSMHVCTCTQLLCQGIAKISYVASETVLHIASHPFALEFHGLHELKSVRCINEIPPEDQVLEAYMESWNLAMRVALSGSVIRKERILWVESNYA